VSTDPSRTDPASAVPTRAVHVDAVADWTAGVRAAGDLLVELGVATDAYVTACVDSVTERGPYIVLAPGLALAHARPEEGATGVGVSVVRLGEPVVFGHPANDPVDLVFAFATVGPGAHLDMLRSLAGALGGGLATRLREAGSVDRLGELLSEAVAGV
jgi:PTS system ascorbate-specific IIA component